VVRDGESCEVEPRLEYVVFAVRAENRSVSRGLLVYDRENSRVSQSVLAQTGVRDPILLKQLTLEAFGLPN
jgi:hypothetical protein